MRWCRPSSDPLNRRGRRVRRETLGVAPAASLSVASPPYSSMTIRRSGRLTEARCAGPSKPTQCVRGRDRGSSRTPRTDRCAVGPRSPASQVIHRDQRCRTGRPRAWLCSARRRVHLYRRGTWPARPGELQRHDTVFDDFVTVLPAANVVGAATVGTTVIAGSSAGRAAGPANRAGRDSGPRGGRHQGPDGAIAAGVPARPLRLPRLDPGSESSRSQ